MKDVVILSTPKSGTNSLYRELTEKYTKHEAFGEIVPFVRMREWDIARRNNVPRLGAVHAHHLSYLDRCISSDTKWYINLPRALSHGDDYNLKWSGVLEQFTSIIISRSVHFTGEWDDPKNTLKFIQNGIKVPTETIHRSIETICYDLQRWCEAARDVTKSPFVEFEVRSVGDLKTEDGKIWEGLDDKFNHIDMDPDALIELVMKEFKKWSLPADLIGTRDLLLSRLDQRSGS